MILRNIFILWGECLTLYFTRLSPKICFRLLRAMTKWVVGASPGSRTPSCLDVLCVWGNLLILYFEDRLNKVHRSLAPRRSQISMPLDKSHLSLHLLILPWRYFTFQYPPTTRIPPHLFADKKHHFLNVTESSEGLSIVASWRDLGDKSDRVGVEGMGEAKEKEGPWGCIRVNGPMDVGE